MDQICVQCSRELNVICASLLKCIMKQAISLIWWRVSRWLRMWAMMRCRFQRQLAGGTSMMRTTNPPPPSASTTSTVPRLNLVLPGPHSHVSSCRHLVLSMLLSLSRSFIFVDQSRIYAHILCDYWLFPPFQECSMNSLLLKTWAI